MKAMTLTALLAALMVAGCTREEPEKIASLHAQVQTLEAEAELRRARNETLQDQVTKLDGELRDAHAERGELLRKLQRPEVTPEADGSTNDEVDKLNQRISELEAEIAALKESAKSKEAEPTPEVEPEIDVETIKRELDGLWPLVQAGDRKAMGEMQEHLHGADKGTRDRHIQRIKDWVRHEPDSKHARVALAVALASRFQDLKDPVQMGALAGEIKDETEKALEIDPDYYEAQHFLAILKVNYPSFMPEFKGADKDLDRALELQADMAWEERFADIYAAYGMWHRVQEQYDEAAARVQAGLDLAPGNQTLLDEKQRIEDARIESED